MSKGKPLFPEGWRNVSIGNCCITSPPKCSKLDKNKYFFLQVHELAGGHLI